MPIPADQVQGLSYFLPARFLKLSVSRELLDPPAIKAALDKKKAELALAKAANQAAEQLVKEKEDALATLPADAIPATIEQAKLVMQLAKGQAVMAARDMNGLSDVVAGLTKLLQEAQVSPTSACTYSAKLELLAPHPDPKARFVARPIHSPVRDDTTKLTVTEAGLLSSSNVIADDKTGQIIVELAGAIGGLGGAPMDLAAADPGETPNVIRCDKMPKKFIRIFDPANPHSRISEDLKGAQFPLVVDVARVDNTPLKAADLGNAGTPANRPQAAIYYRSAVPLRVTVRECLDGKLGCGISDSSVMDESLVMIPQAGPVSYIPMRSNAFVKTVNDVQFENGMIKSWSAERPSEVLEVVRLPVKILTSLISVPATLLQLRVNYNVNAKSLAESQQGEIKASETLRTLRTCLALAGDDPAKAKICLSQ